MRWLVLAVVAAVAGCGAHHQAPDPGAPDAATAPRDAAAALDAAAMPARAPRAACTS